MRVKRLIKTFAFEEGNRGRIELGAGMRLHPELHRLVLDGPPYSTDADIHAKTWVTSPASVKRWIGFEARIRHVLEAGSPVTGASYRLSDGTDEFWWNSSAWEVNTADWNTEEEVAANIPDFPIASRKLQVIVNLTTTDASATPRLECVKVLWTSDVEFLEDILYRSLVPALRDGIRPIADYIVHPSPGPTSSIDLDDFPLETPYNLVGIDSVYDHTADPDHLTNLFISYDPGTKVIALSPAIPDGNLAFIRFLYEPEVAVTTSQDYNEVSKVPALILDDVNLVDATQRGTDDWVLNKGTNEAVLLPGPVQGSLDVTMNSLTDKGVDQKRLEDEISRFFGNNPLLRSVGLDETYSLWLIDEYDMRTPPGSADLHTGRVRFRVRDVVFYVRDAVDRTGVKRFLVTGTEDFVLA